MQVILLQRIEKLGQMGQFVDVKPGFARNYLLPQKKALRATKENIAYFETQKAVLEVQNLKKRQEAEEAAKMMEGVSVTLIRQASETGQLYGSIRPKDICDALVAASYKVGRNQIHIGQPLKVLGLHNVSLSLHPEVSVSVRVNIAQSEEEAQAQAKKESN